MDAFFDYEKKAEEIRQKNEEYLEGFEALLEAEGLSDKTINLHLKNVYFYINSFLLNYDALDAGQGCYSIGEFLGNWFIRKAMWSTVATIKSNITSLKKFYKYLLGRGVVEKVDYDALCETIDENKFEWFDLVSRYNDPNEDNPFSPF